MIGVCCFGESLTIIKKTGVLILNFGFDTNIIIKHLLLVAIAVLFAVLSTLYYNRKKLIKLQERQQHQMLML